jgi:hypothetical protein
MWTWCGIAFALAISAVLLSASCMTPSRLTLGNSPDPWALPREVEREESTGTFDTWDAGIKIGWLGDLLPFRVPLLEWVPVSGRIQMPRLFHGSFQVAHQRTHRERQGI